MTLLLLNFTLCFLLHLWAHLNLAVLLITGRAHHRHGPQSPPSALELHPQRHQGGTLCRPNLTQVRDAHSSFSEVAEIHKRNNQEVQILL